VNTDTAVEQPQQVNPAAGKRVIAVASALLAGVLAAGVIYYGIESRVSAESRLAASTNQAAVQTVSVIRPQNAARAQDLLLPGTTQAFIDSPVYARTNGYLKRWYCDIGARVKAGDLLAEIETPELDQQLRQARADLATSQANLNLSKITADRNVNLLKTHSISTQERDNAVNGYAANEATVQSNAANVARLEQLQAYERVIAPFDGVVTARNTDVGALIDAGANARTQLFHMAAIYKLRVYVSIPEVYARAARPGGTAELTLDEFPGRGFHGSVVRHSNSIDLSSRTLLTEVDVDNLSGTLMPGSYVQVHFRLPGDVHAVIVPVNTLLFRKEGLQVGVVRNGKAEMVSVTPGHDYGDSMEIVAGLHPNDQVIVNPSDSLTSGTAVLVAQQRGRP
jgi:RND family efflux transporter MFP subunit